MTAPVFVATNLFVYARDARQAAKQRIAMDWLEHLWRERSGRTCVQVLSEYFVTVTRKLSPGMSPAAAWEDVTALLTWRPCPSDASLLKHGNEFARRYRLGWWDSLVVAAAALQDCSLLLTEDLQDGAVLGTVTVRNPFAAGVAETARNYQVEHAVARRHSRRGRPRRTNVDAGR